jgi:hypothetical protein
MNVRIGIDFSGVIVRSLHEEIGEDMSLRSFSAEQDVDQQGVVFNLKLD